MLKKGTTLLALFLLVASLIACNGTTVVEDVSLTPQVPMPTSEPTPLPLTLEMLRQTSYVIDGEIIQLEDGRAEQAILEGSESVQQITLLDETVAFGDLNGDGIEDAAAVLTMDMGGSGTFYYLAATINEGAEHHPVSTVLLGDRIQIKTIAIEAGEVAIAMIEAGPEDPMCCPTLETSKHYALQSNSLIRSDLPPLLGPVWGWVQTTTAEGVFASNGPERYTIQLNEDRSYAAQVDCNSMSGTYILSEDGSTIELIPGPMTQMGCPADTLDTNYLGYLGNARSIELAERDMYITLADGSVMKFVLPDEFP
ncbi:MAG: META domain-containing protein [Ardenticatenales bacterium]|nr:META domain-containing protein [Ardenticatenales bacterium]